MADKRINFIADDETQQHIKDVQLKWEKQGLKVGISNVIRMAIKQLAEK